MDPRKKNIAGAEHVAPPGSSMANGWQSTGTLSGNSEAPAIGHPNNSNPNMPVPMQGAASGLINGGVNANTGNLNVGVMPPSTINPGTMNPNLSHPVSSAMNGITPNPNVDNLSQYSGYTNSSNLPPPSPSMSKRRIIKQRPQSVPGPGLSNDMSMVGGKSGLPVSRKVVGNRVGVGNNVKNAAAAASMYHQQQRLQSPGAKLVQAPSSESLGSVSLALSVGGGPPYNPHLLAQQQKKKAYRSTTPMQVPSQVVSNPIPGQDLSGVSNAMHPMSAARSTQATKVRSPSGVSIGIMSPGMTPMPAGKTAVKSPSPSQVSIHSGDLSSLQQMRGATAGANPRSSYDLSLAATLTGGNVPPGTGTGVGGKRVMTGAPRADSQSKQMDFNQQALAEAVAHAGKGALREDMMPGGPATANAAAAAAAAAAAGVMPPNMAGKSPTAPAFIPDGSVSHLQARSMHGLNPAAAAATRIGEKVFLAAGGSANPSAAMNTMSRVANQRLRAAAVKGKDGSVVTELEAQLQQAGNMHMDGSGAAAMKDKMGNPVVTNMRLGQNMMGHVNASSQGYFGAPGLSPSTVQGGPPPVSSDLQVTNPNVAAAAALKGQTAGLNMLGITPGNPNSVMPGAPPPPPSGPPTNSTAAAVAAVAAAAANNPNPAVNLLRLPLGMQLMPGGNLPSNTQLGGQRQQAQGGLPPHSQGQMQSPQHSQSLTPQHVPVPAPAPQAPPPPPPSSAPQMPVRSQQQTTHQQTQAQQQQQQHSANMLNLFPTGMGTVGNPGTAANSTAGQNSSNSTVTATTENAITATSAGTTTATVRPGTQQSQQQAQPQAPQQQQTNLNPADAFLQMFSGASRVGPAAQASPATTAGAGAGALSLTNGLTAAAGGQGLNHSAAAAAALSLGPAHSLGLPGHGSSGLQGQHGGVALGSGMERQQQREMTVDFNEDDLLDDCQSLID